MEGRVVDAERGAPIAGASLSWGHYEERTDVDGHFRTVPLPPDVTLLVKAPGYERKRVPVHPGRTTIALAPQTIKAVYLTYYGVGERMIRERVFELVNRTELNAVVIDVKGDRGLIPYPTQVPLAVEAGAMGPVRIRTFDEMLGGLKARGVYTIARIVVFKDNVLANYRPEWAVLDTRTGKPWMDNERLAWVDPFREEVWEYAIAIAREAALKGFDEIQLDYVRFPTDGKLSAARYSRPNTKQNRLEAISTFLARMRKALVPMGVFLAADIFGYTAFNENDTDIGQRLEELAPHVDYLCPMVYPSGYHRGIPGYRNPVAHPYEIVFETVRLVRRRSSHATIRVRPWIQDFRDYAFDRRPFGVKELQAQMKAAQDAGAVGWMLWNPRNEYTAAALRPKYPVTVRLTHSR
ncbi:MAG: GTP-binding protein [Candidatus Rokubacteria bacterium]|nr:GTP-binding protein [Candidatus Rokubacteria bacterium]